MIRPLIAAAGIFLMLPAGVPAVFLPALAAGARAGAAGQAASDGVARPLRPGGSRPARLKAPRLAPLPDERMTDAQRQLIHKYSPTASPGNAFTTLLQVPGLVDGMIPFRNYISRDSSLLPRHRELLILRTAWLVGSEYIWMEHAPLGVKAGLARSDLRRIAQGAGPGWSPIEAALLRLADEMFRNCFVNDATWSAVDGSYDLYHLMDAVMTVAATTSHGLVFNSLGIEPDEGSTDHLPTEVPYRIVVPAPEPPLKVARVEPVPGKEIAINRTFARYPALAEPRATGSNYVNRVSTLEPRYRELLILRTGWNCQSEYEWAQHVGPVGRGRELGLPVERIAAGGDAPGWDPFEATLLRAADELYRDSLLTDRTWAALESRLGDTNLTVSALVTVANYRMVSMALNALGVQLEPGDERFPTPGAR